MDVSPKVAAASAATGLTGSLAIVAAWALSLTGAQITPEVAIALATVLMSAASFIGGYVVRHVAPESAPVNPQ